MQYDKLLREDKRKLLNIVKHEYVKLDFSKLTNVLDNNYIEPLWMDISVLMYKLKIENPDISIFDILLKKLSKQFVRFYFKDGEKRYIVTADEFDIKQYVWFLITKENVEYCINTQYIPPKDYIKQILNLNKFTNLGVYIKHISEDEFSLIPINQSFSNIDEAEIIYNEMIQVKDLKNSLNLSVKNLLENFEEAKVLSKDKRMIATLSNILSSFRCEYELKDNHLTIKDTNLIIEDEESAMSFQSKIIDAYHFFRNVINTENKKDIVSEIYNKKVD